MKYKYGTFPDRQFNNYKVRLHKDLFWLLLYKDPKTASDFADVDFNKYFIGLMRRIDGLNELLHYPPEIIDILIHLEAAYGLTKDDNFDYSAYRKLILDAHNIVDRICDIGGDCDDNINEL